MQRGFKIWAERKSGQLRSAVHVPIHGCLPAIVLARHLGLTVVGPHELLEISTVVLNELLGVSYDRWSAVTIPIGGKAVIVHNTRHAPCRQESNLMHEMAHVICAHKGATVQCSGKLPWAFRTYSKDQEDEANWLGACLQIPRAGLVWAIGRRMTDLAIAKHFNASEALVKFRRNTTGVDVQRRGYVSTF